MMLIYVVFNFVYTHTMHTTTSHTNIITGIWCAFYVHPEKEDYKTGKIRRYMWWNDAFLLWNLIVKEFKMYTRRTVYVLIACVANPRGLVGRREFRKLFPTGNGGNFQMQSQQLTGICIICCCTLSIGYDVVFRKYEIYVNNVIYRVSKSNKIGWNCLHRR